MLGTGTQKSKNNKSSGSVSWRMYEIFSEVSRSSHALNLYNIHCVARYILQKVPKHDGIVWYLDISPPSRLYTTRSTGRWILVFFSFLLFLCCVSPTTRPYRQTWIKKWLSGENGHGAGDVRTIFHLPTKEENKIEKCISSRSRYTQCSLLQSHIHHAVVLPFSTKYLLNQFSFSSFSRFYILSRNPTDANEITAMFPPHSVSNKLDQYPIRLRKEKLSLMRWRWEDSHKHKPAASYSLNENISHVSYAICSSEEESSRCKETRAENYVWNSIYIV